MAHVAYPVHLGIAYLFLVGYLARTVFVSLRLPASVGVLISGFVFSHFFQDDLHDARGSLQDFAFFCVLFEAGLDLTLRDLQPYIFVMAWIPWMFEVVAVAWYAMLFLGFTRHEGLVLGNILSTLGPGLVMPKMKEFGAQFEGHPLPRLLFTWAPLEGCMALISFGFSWGLVPSEQPTWTSKEIGMLVLANAFRILATLGMGVFLGSVSGWLISRRMQLRVAGQPVFTGTPVETFLMALAAALIGYSLGAESSQGRIFLPLGFAPGSLFQSELMVVALGTTFAMVADRDILHEVEGIMGGVWVFGQLILFSMIGSGTSLSILPEVTGILPLMGIGLLARLLGVFLVVFTTRRARGCEMQSCWATTEDACFCFLGTLPRATLQAALGNVPATTGFFRGAPNEKNVERYIYLGSRVYILCMSLVGQTLLNTFGPLLLDRTMQRPTEEYCKGRPGAGKPGSKGADHTSVTSISTVCSSEYERNGAIGLLAEEHGVSPEILRLLLEEAQDAKDHPTSQAPPVPHPSQDGFSLVGHSMARHGSEGDLVLSQFDTIGSLYSGSTPATEWRHPRKSALRRAYSTNDLNRTRRAYSTDD